MSYFIALETPNGPKALNRRVYATKMEAWAAVPDRSVAPLFIEDADHEPGLSMLKARHGFA